MTKHILVDIDHVLSDAAWRDNMLPPATDWDTYHFNSQYDKPIHSIKNLINTLSLQGYIIIAHTSRPEKWRDLTIGWFIHHVIKIDELIMRPNDDFRPAHEIKIEQAKNRFLPDDFRNHVSFIMDDNDMTCSLYRELGITIFQVFAKNTV